MKRLIWAVVVALMVGVGSSAAQESPEPSPALQQQMAELEQTTSDLRGLDLVQVDHVFPSREQVAQYLEEDFDTQLPGDELDRYKQFYVALDLLDPDTDLRRVYLDLLSAQIAGYYDTDTKTMNIVLNGGEVPDSLSPLQQVTYVHEYTHALDDANFNIEQIQEGADDADNVDRDLAVLAVIEGDATATMTVFTQQLVTEQPLAALQMLTEGAASGGLTLPPDTPTILSRELLYPYEGGLQFISALYNMGGWDEVNRAFMNPPTSSEQIIHPEKYVGGDTPVPVTLGDTAGALGSGWTQLWDTPLGEWYLREYLRTQLPRTQAFNAAAGWGGDHFQVFQNAKEGTLAWTLGLVWDTPADADEFATLYARFAGARYDTDVRNNCWSDADSTTCMNATQTETLITQAPTRDEAEAMLAAQGVTV